MNQKLDNWYKKIVALYSGLNKESFYRILILYFGINFDSQNSYIDPNASIEAVFSIPELSSIPFLVLLRSNSPFTLINSGTTNHKVLLYKNKYVGETYDYSQTVLDLNKNEPYYLFVKEANDNIVLKLNPIQLCDFYNEKSNSPCFFCFRNDHSLRYKNTTSDKLLDLITHETPDFFKQLNHTSEVSVTTGSYESDGEFVEEIIKLINGIKKFAPKNCRITVGSHELKNEKDIKAIKKAGVTDLTIPIEILSNNRRKLLMNNRKGKITIETILLTLTSALNIFGDDHVIVRVIAGLGDPINKEFKENIEKINGLGARGKGPKWNINIYTPFTHSQFNSQKQDPVSDLKYIFGFCSIIMENVPTSRFLRFKISP